MMNTRHLLLLGTILACAAHAQSTAPITPSEAPAPPRAMPQRPSPYSAPMAVPPVGVAPGVAAVPPVVAPPPPVNIPRPAVVGNCDAAGCWDSNGRHLPRVGPNVQGPRGPCTTLNGVVNCP
jgi:hypothetical protein